MKIVVPLADGFEEIEAVSIIDVVRRAGIEVIIAGVERDVLKGAHDISIKADCLISDINGDEFDMIVLPGGYGGTMILAKNQKVQSLLKEFDAKNKNIGAICAAPIALKEAGVIKNRYTCYPSVEDVIGVEKFVNETVVEDENILTSRGPGTAICFGLAIVKKLAGEESYQALKNGLLATYCK